MTTKGGENRDGQGKEAEPPEAHREESHQKQIVRKVVPEVEKEGESIVSSDTYRGKQLPAGMKVKKRLSAEESAKENRVEQAKAKSRENSSGEEDPSNPTSSLEPVDPEKTSPAHQDLPRDKNPTFDLPLRETPSDSFTKSGSQASNKDSEGTQDQSSKCPPQSAKIIGTKPDKDDDEEVVLVSVKPATTKSPPVSAVQKTLTTFPGFQPASKVKDPQGDPQGLRNLFSSQLKQKKVRLWTGALPYVDVILHL